MTSHYASGLGEDEVALSSLRSYNPTKVKTCGSHVELVLEKIDLLTPKLPDEPEFELLQGGDFSRERIITYINRAFAAFEHSRDWLGLLQTLMYGGQTILCLDATAKDLALALGDLDRAEYSAAALPLHSFKDRTPQYLEIQKQRERAINVIAKCLQVSPVARQTKTASYAVDTRRARLLESFTFLAVVMDEAEKPKAGWTYEDVKSASFDTYKILRTAVDIYLRDSVIRDVVQWFVKASARYNESAYYITPDRMYTLLIEAGQTAETLGLYQPLNAIPFEAKKQKEAERLELERVQQARAARAALEAKAKKERDEKLSQARVAKWKAEVQAEKTARHYKTVDLAFDATSLVIAALNSGDLPPLVPISASLTAHGEVARQLIGELSEFQTNLNFLASTIMFRVGVTNLTIKQDTDLKCQQLQGILNDAHLHQTLTEGYKLVAAIGEAIAQPEELKAVAQMKEWKRFNRKTIGENVDYPRLRVDVVLRNLAHHGVAAQVKEYGSKLKALAQEARNNSGHPTPSDYMRGWATWLSHQAEHSHLKCAIEARLSDLRRDFPELAKFMGYQEQH